MKTCSKCKVEKSLSEFSKDASRSDGLQYNCKSCRGAIFAAYRAANIEKIMARNAAYIAANPAKIKARNVAYRERCPEKIKSTNAKYCADNSAKIKKCSATYYLNNADRILARSGAWYAANKDKAKERAAKYHAKNPESAHIRRHRRRARLRSVGGTLSKGITERLYKLQNGLCACCGTPLGDRYHLDHRMPLALGGTNTDDNMQLLTKRCNLQKGAKHPNEFAMIRLNDYLTNYGVCEDAA